MSCKHHPERLATGNAIQRAIARWHARRCPDCRRAAELIEGLRQELSAADSLSDAQRQLWSRAMDHEPVPAERQVVERHVVAEPIATLLRPLTAARRRPAWAASLAAAAVAVFALGWVAGRLTSVGDRNMVERQNGSRDVVSPDVSPDEREAPQRPNDQEKTPAHQPDSGALVIEVQPPGTFPSTLDPPSSVEEVRTALLALSGRLDELAAQAALLDEREEITRLAELSRPTR